MSESISMTAAAESEAPLLGSAQKPTGPLTLRGKQALAVEGSLVLVLGLFSLFCSSFEAARMEEPVMSIFGLPLFCIVLSLAGLAVCWNRPFVFGAMTGTGCWFSYLSVVGLMILGDVLTRMYLGELQPFLIVLSGFCNLLISASAINLFRFFKQYNCLSMFGFMLLQLAQAYVSVLSAASPRVVLSVLVVRRVIGMVTVHVLSYRSYGMKYSSLIMTRNLSFEYIAVKAATMERKKAATMAGEGQEDALAQDASDDSMLIEDQESVGIIGRFLIALPFFSGCSMGAGWKSLTRYFDILIFLEQMVAFASPSMVMDADVARIQIQGLSGMLKIAEDDSDDLADVDEGKEAEKMKQVDMAEADAAVSRALGLRTLKSRQSYMLLVRTFLLHSSSVYVEHLLSSSPINSAMAICESEVGNGGKNSGNSAPEGDVEMAALAPEMLVSEDEFAVDLEQRKAIRKVGPIKLGTTEDLILVQ